MRSYNIKEVLVRVIETLYNEASSEVQTMAVWGISSRCH
jgi:hypothetical protein